jgi:3',5'-cyclic AMP phosphodiesterase CpdA
MTRILHLSDTHFGTERPQVVEALIALARALAPQLIVVSGDITQRATRAQFTAARRFLDALPPCPRLLLPGNHDIPLFALWQRAYSPYARYCAGLEVAALAPTLSLPGVHAIAVKTTRRWRHIDGEVSPAQVEAVAATLRALPTADLKLVVTHQPLWVERAEDAHNRCHGADAALTAWIEAGADLCLAGHIHWPFAARLPQARTAWAINAGTAVSRRVRPGAPNSVNLIEWSAADGERTCRWTRYDCAAEGAPFVALTPSVLALA